ncbi:MAG: DEAD/DEAH box helicase [Hyphomicrobiales bacterium]|nr:DEAD/DEAH box helicase [Hyphomicrobiales bacterium]
MLKLDPYQETGVAWLAGNKRPVLYLADQMRVGKTPQVAAAAGRIGAKRVLVICPAIVRPNWLADFVRFGAGVSEANTVLIYSAKDVERVTPETRLIVCSYDLAGAPDVFSKLYSFGAVYGFDLLALDEGHFLKDNRAKRTRAILGPKCNGDEGLAGCARRTWWVSGTPMPNDPSELFPFMRQAGLWPKSKTDLISRYCFGFHDGYTFKITGAKNLPELKRLLAPVTLRRLRGDVSEAGLRIGALTIEPREVDPLSPVLKRLANEEPKHFELIQRHLETDTLDRLPIESASTVRRLVGIAKVAGTAEIVKASLDADPGKKIVVFGIHRAPLRYLRGALDEYKPVLIFGGIAAKRRENLIMSFRQNRNRRVALANIRAAGLGIDLSAADEMYIFEPSWTPVDNEQALSRIIDVRRPCVKEAWFIGLASSIDDAVTRVCERKARDIKSLFSAV